MKKLISFLIVFLIIQENKISSFVNISHAVFKECVKEVARHSDVKSFWFIMLGCPRLQRECLNFLHNKSNKIPDVRLITDRPYELCLYPYFSQTRCLNTNKLRKQMVLFLGINSKPLFAIQTQNQNCGCTVNLINSSQALEDLQNKFDEDWKRSSNRK